MTQDAFRFDLGALCLNFVATVGSRKSDAPIERIGDTDRLRQWIQASGLIRRNEDMAPLHEKDRIGLIGLREVLYRLLHDLVRHSAAQQSDIAFVNRVADAHARPVLQLRCGDGDSNWWAQWSRPLHAHDIAALIAADAIALIGGGQCHLLKECAGSTCDGIYVDNSRGFNRTWCSSRACGNNERVRRFRQST